MFLGPLNIHAPNWAPFIFYDDNKEITGRDFQFVQILSKALNFKANVTVFKELAAWGMLFENGTATGVIKNLLDSKADLIVGDYYLRAVRMKYMDASVEYFSADVIFVIPPGRSLASIEKLLQPFNSDVWITLAAASFCGVAFLVLLNLLTKGAHKTKLVGLFFKAASILFAVSLSQLPRRTFHRMLLGSYVIICLVLAAGYQGALFRFLQKDSKLKELQSIEEMIEKDYRIYSYDSMLESIQGESKIMNRLSSIE